MLAVMKMGVIKKTIKRLVYRIRGEYTVQQLEELGLHVGENFSCLHGTVLDPAHCWLIDIGDNVTLAPDVHILCHDASTKSRLGYTKIGRVNIGDRVFIGAHTVILPGVSIGDDVIVGANSTVTKDIPEGMVYAGCPAKPICTTNQYLEKERNRMKETVVYDEEWTLRKNVSMEKRMKQKNDLRDKKIGYVD